MFFSVILLGFMATGALATTCPPQLTYEASIDRCYIMFNFQTTYDMAKQVCAAKEASLIIADTNERDQFYSGVSQGRSLWLNLERESNISPWKWAGETELVYTNWRDGEPSPGSSDLNGIMRRYGSASRSQWDAISISGNRNYFICESLPCVDKIQTCEASLIAQPEFCSVIPTTDVDCRFTCGLCDIGRTERCPVSPMDPNVEVSATSSTIPRGSFVEYSCKEGFVQSGGDSRRACLASGQLSGEEFTCREALDCPEGYVYYEPSSSCFRLETKPLSYDNARQNCIDNGDRLVSFKSREEEQFVIDNTGEVLFDIAWIGLRRTNLLSPFVWEDGSDPADTYTNWGLLQPSIVPTFDCVFYVNVAPIPLQPQFWINFNCALPLVSVCRRDSGAF